MFTFKRKPDTNTPFSEFIRNAPAAEKKAVYTRVLKQAAERQRAVMAKRVKTA